MKAHGRCDGVILEHVEDSFVAIRRLLSLETSFLNSKPNQNG